MISIEAIISLIIFHWFADYVMQPGEWAINKSKSIYALLKHTSTYTVILGLLMLINPWTPMLTNEWLIFVLTTFVLHTLTDYFTSKWSSLQYQRGNFGTSVPRGMDFFVTLGFDQVLHGLQIFITYWYLTSW
jgi:hypothetical protein